jgi:hypothetical protein
MAIKSSLVGFGAVSNIGVKKPHEKFRVRYDRFGPVRDAGFKPCINP